MSTIEQSVTQLERVLHYARKNVRPPMADLSFSESSTSAEIIESASALVERIEAFKAFQSDLEQLLPIARSIEIDGVIVAVARPNSVTVGAMLESPNSFPRAGLRSEDLIEGDFEWINPMKTPIKSINVSPIRKARLEAERVKRRATKESKS